MMQEHNRAYKPQDRAYEGQNSTDEFFNLVFHRDKVSKIENIGVKNGTDGTGHLNR